MKNCADPGMGIWYSTSDNKKRKYPHTWEIAISAAGHLIGINTIRANHFVKEALQAGIIPSLGGYETLLTERQYGSEGSRVDIFLCDHAKEKDCFLEVKSVTLLDESYGQGVGLFPDAISTRGTKHLRELMGVISEGGRGVLFFCVQHTGIKEVRPADDIDKVYGETLRAAYQAGVEIIAYRTDISPTSIVLAEPVNVNLGL